MKFHDKGRPLSGAGMDGVCEHLGLALPEVWAVLAVETLGFGFFQDRRPPILFERHVFHRLTGGLYAAENPDICNSDSGGYTRGVKEYARLEKAMKLDQDAGLKSASWGIGQVMGFNHEVAGFDAVDDMVSALVKTEDAQLLAMANFIEGNSLGRALRRHDWAGFACGYNGSGYKKNKYDTKLAAAYAKYQGALPDLTLRTAQASLLYLGIDPGPVDGLQGQRTQEALRRFQEARGLPAAGGLDGDTEARLLAEAFPD